MDLGGHPDKEILSLQGFSKKKELAGTQVSLQKRAKSKSNPEAIKCFKQVGFADMSN